MFQEKIFLVDIIKFRANISLSSKCITYSAIGVCCPDEDTERSSPQFADEEDIGQGPLFGDQQLRIDNPEEVINRPEERGCGLSTKQFGKYIVMLSNLVKYIIL